MLKFEMLRASNNLGYNWVLQPAVYQSEHKINNYYCVYFRHYYGFDLGILLLNMWKENRVSDTIPHKCTCLLFLWMVVSLIVNLHWFFIFYFTFHVLIGIYCWWLHLLFEVTNLLSDFRNMNSLLRRKSWWVQCADA